MSANPETKEWDSSPSSPSPGPAAGPKQEAAMPPPPAQPQAPSASPSPSSLLPGDATGDYGPESEPSGATGEWTDNEKPLATGTYLLKEESAPAGAKGEKDKAAVRTTAARYLLKKLHAQGGMGEIWLAEDKDIGRQVALKRIRKGMDGCRVPFLLEAQVTGQLEHPGVVPVHEVGNDEEGRPFYVMKFVHGRTLKDAIHDYHLAPRPGGQVGEVPREVQWLRLLQVFIDLCHTVAYAHSRGVLHRDLKPENVMVGPYGETLVLDWGLAKVVGQAEAEGVPQAPILSSGEYEATRAGRIKGTPSYMSPESATGKPADIDERSDIYLLGATLYHILTGKAPRNVKTMPEFLEQIKAPPPPPRRLNAAVPRPLEAICLKAIAQAKEDRYASASELAEDVNRFLVGEPVAAYRETVWERAWRWCRKHRVLIGRSAAAAAVLALLGFGFYKFKEMQRQWEDERQENARSLQEAEDRRARADREAKELQAQKQAQGEVERFRELAEETRFFAASTNPVAEHAPFFDPRKGEALGQEALGIAAAWGEGLDQLPLAHEREPLKKDIYDLRLLMAHALAGVGGREEQARAALAHLDQAGRSAAPTRAYHQLRADLFRLLGQADAAAAERKRADDPATPVTALDHFLQGEQARTQAAQAAGADAERKVWEPDRKQLQEAVQHYRSALRLDPNHYWSHFQIGRCYLALGKNAEAVEALGTCVALRPGSPWGYSARGLALCFSRRYEEARADLDRALALDPHARPPRLNRGVAFWMEKKYDEALSDFEAVLQPPADRRLVEAAFYRAQLHLERGKLDDALADLDRLSAEKHNLRTAHLVRAQVYFSLGQDDQGLEALDAFLANGRAFDRAGPEACEQRGQRLRQIAMELPPLQRRGKLRLAHGELQKAVAQGRRTAVVFDELGAVCENLGRADEAVEAYSRAIELSPKEVRLRVKRGWAYEKLQPPDYEKAQADFAAALELDPSHAEAHTGLGYIQACRNQDAEARRQAHRAILHGAGDYLVLHNVACIYGRLAQDGKQAAEYENLAIDQLRRAVELWKRDRSGPNELQLIQVDQAFSPALRARPEFQKLFDE